MSNRKTVNEVVIAIAIAISNTFPTDIFQVDFHKRFINFNQKFANRMTI